MSSSSIQMAVDGMTCKHCASTVEGIIKQQGGSRIRVDYLMGEASFDLGDEQAMERIAKKLKEAGYEARGSSAQKSSGWSTIEKKFAFTLPFSLLLFTHMFVAHDAWINHGYVQLALCFPVFLLGLYHFGKSTVSAIKVGSINMDILILLGSSSAFIYSLIGLIQFGPGAHSYLYFETTSTIITLVLLGYVIEHRAVQKTTESLRDLLDLAPAKAKRLDDAGLNQDIKVVEASELKKGDRVLLNEGDAIPADGSIEHGNLEVDQSMLTGESKLLSKSKGSELLSGSIVHAGNATMRVSQPSTQSTLSRIISLAKNSRSDEPRIQRLADKISSIFVPAVLGIAVLFFALNFLVFDTALGESVMRSIAVLVISCPCAMGLATPTAVSVGLGLANKLGIVLKRASTLEVLKKAEWVLFDKTGTLTDDRISLAMKTMSDQYPASTLLGLAKSLEQRSSHPLADAIAQMDAPTDPVALENVKEHKGKGLSGTWDGKEVQLGSAAFTDQNSGADLWLVIDQNAAARFERKERLRSDASDMIHRLKKSGKSVEVISGDAQERVEAAAHELGIDSFHSEMLPEQKLEHIRERKSNGITVMVGDGINDGPALSAADVGISIGTQNALASESADVVLLSDRLKSVVELFRISEKTVAAIQQNLFWAFSYNLIAIPLAGLGYLDPMVAALSMAFSDVVVIGNSLRLRLILPKSID